MKKENYKKELIVAKKIALKAGKIMLKYFDIDQETKRKKDNSEVTIADITINKMVIKEILKVFPNDGIIGEEESTAEYGMGRKWICDPIDGTAAFVWGVPTSMFSLGFVVDGTSVLGVAYDPYLKRIYYAVKGNGSYCNGKKLKVSNTKLENGYFALSAETTKLPRENLNNILKALGTKIATYSGAVSKGCLMAKGKFVGYVDVAVCAHDMAAIQVIIEEAGGKVTAISGERLDYSQPFHGALATNGTIHKKILEIIHQK